MLSEFQGAYSVLLFETTSTPVTGSILLSISATSSGMPSLYYISISRAGDVTGNPNLKVKVLSGSYNIKIKAKTEADGKCRVYAASLYANTKCTPNEFFWHINEDGSSG